MVSQFLSVLLLKAFQVALNFSSHINIFACQSVQHVQPFFFEKAKIYTFKDVDCKKDHQEGPYLNHLGKKLTIAFKAPSLAAIVVCNDLKFTLLLNAPAYAGAFKRRVNLRSLHGHLQRI